MIVGVQGVEGRPYYDAWGKAAESAGILRWHRLIYHSLDTAAVASELLHRETHWRDQLASVTRLDPEDLSLFLPYLIALHDLGKLSPSFQDLRREIVEQMGVFRARTAVRERHEHVGLSLLAGNVLAVGAAEQWLRCEVGGRVVREIDQLRALLEPWFRAVVGHHGHPPPRLPQLNAPIGEEIRGQAVMMARDLAMFFRPPVLRLQDASDATRALAASAWAIAGFTTVVDWIASNQRYFPYCPEVLPFDRYWDRARAQSTRAITESGLLPPSPAPRRSFASLFPHFHGPRPMQALASTIPIGPGPQLFVIEDGPGSGKTEAALVLLQRLLAGGHAQGVYVALPHGALGSHANKRLADIERKLYVEGEPSVVFAHGARHLADIRVSDEGAREPPYHATEDTASNACAEWFGDPRKKAFLASVGIGTLDQAQLAVVPSSFAAVRAFGLMRNVLWADALESHDAVSVRLLEALLEQQASLGGSAILTTVALPFDVLQRYADAFRRGAGAPRSPLREALYPLITTASTQGILQEAPRIQLPEQSFVVRFIYRPGAALEMLSRRLSEGCCVCWIRNSVEDAIEAYRNAVAVLGKESVTLMHERFLMGDRLEIERDVMSRFGPEGSRIDRAGRLVIATRTIEAMDVDFDELISDLAPIDVILQRAGRLRRHTRPRRPHGEGFSVMYLLAPEWSDAPQPYWFSSFLPSSRDVFPDHGQLWLTMRLLRERGGVLLPEDVRWLIESVFDQEAQEEIPDALWRTSDRVDSARSEEAQERQRPISPWSGYQRVHRVNVPDTVSPGAHGREMVTFRFARLAAGALLPLVDTQHRQGWELSQIDLPRARVARRLPGELEAEIAVAEPLMPDRGRSAVTAVMTWDAVNEAWHATAADEAGHVVQLLYRRDLGLRFQ